MKKLLILFATAALLCIGCGEKYDDSALNNRVDNLENRIAKLEELCKQMNTNISSLQTLVNALQNNDYVTGVTPVTSGGSTIGYTITFSKSAPITIYHGQNGKDGADGKDGINGTDGKDGKDGRTPIVGVRQDTDGIYYWTLDGEWLLDNSGNKIQAEGRDGKDGENGKDGADGKDGVNGKDGQNGADGKDGKDGITPQLKIENGYWYVSTDNGATWTNLGKATGEDGKDGADGKDGTGGDSIFQSVTQDDDNVYFTLADGETIVLPKKLQLAITFAEGNELFFDIDQTITANYTIIGGSDKNIVKAEMQNNDGYYTLRTTQTNATNGTIAITAKVPTTNRVIVSVSDGSHTIMEAIDVSMKSSFDGKVAYVKTPGTLAKLLADWDEETMKELTIVGNLNDSDISTLNDLPNLAVLDMEHVNLDILPNSAFKNNTSLTDVKLPRTLKTIAPETFGKCSSLTSITIPNSVTSIGNSAFANCSSLASITIPDSVTNIGQNAFNGCSSLTSITIPNSITEIGNGTFSDCSSLTSITIPNSVTEIGMYVFHNCSSLTSITIPDSVTEIRDATFYRCSSLTNITIPDNVISIENNAFRACSSLISITIPDSVTSIGRFAFYDCSSLTSATIGNGITSIGNCAFALCRKLENCYCKALIPPTLEPAVFDPSVSFFVPVASVGAYKNAENWSEYADQIEGYDFNN